GGLMYRSSKGRSGSRVEKREAFLFLIRTPELITIPFLVSTASDFSRDFTNMSLIPCGEFLFPETGMVSSTISCPRHMECLQEKDTNKSFCQIASQDQLTIGS